MPKLKLILQLGLVFLSIFVVYRVWQAFDLNQRYQRFSQAIFSLQSTQVKPVPTPKSPYRYPPIKELLLRELTSTWNLKDTYALRACSLDGLVFANNSTQAKNQTGWLQLQYQLDLINGLFDCLQRRELDPALELKISDLLRHKRSQLPIYWNNFLVTEPALINQWQVSGLRYDKQRYYSKFPIDSLAVLSALKTYVLSAELPIAYNETSVLQTLYTLDGKAYLSPLISDLQLALIWLPTLNNQLKQVTNCPSSKQDLIYGILSRYFTQGTQLELARLDTALNQVISPLQRIYFETTHEAQITQLIRQKNQLHGFLKVHVQQWQRLISLCDGKK
ncbi:DUF3080 family protein [Alginatibacterium sediminis]|uniref:DUF3080 family protein n=1 Tax=Alginatibacterium sediminis TaxID=2164068 RepID=UPI0013141332|nr:DUF3080 family protein [Alginatibacterium sediminis]